jgi:hypothetical protein
MVEKIKACFPRNWNTKIPHESDDSFRIFKGDVLDAENLFLEYLRKDEFSFGDTLTLFNTREMPASFVVKPSVKCGLNRALFLSSEAGPADRMHYVWTLRIQQHGGIYNAFDFTIDEKYFIRFSGHKFSGFTNFIWFLMKTKRIPRPIIAVAAISNGCTLFAHLRFRFNKVTRTIGTHTKSFEPSKNRPTDAQSSSLPQEDDAMVDLEPSEASYEAPPEPDVEPVSVKPIETPKPAAASALPIRVSYVCVDPSVEEEETRPSSPIPFLNIEALKSSNVLLASAPAKPSSFEGYQEMLTKMEVERQEKKRMFENQLKSLEQEYSAKRARVKQVHRAPLERVRAELLSIKSRIDTELLSH